MEVYAHMAPEDGCLWVYGPDDHQIPAFTDFGLECQTDFIREHKPIAAAVKSRAGKSPGS